MSYYFLVVADKPCVCVFIEREEEERWMRPSPSTLYGMLVTVIDKVMTQTTTELGPRGVAVRVVNSQLLYFFQSQEPRWVLYCQLYKVH